MSRTGRRTKSRKKGNKILPQKKEYIILILIMMLVGVGFLSMMVFVDAFPVKLTMGIIAIMFLIIILADFLYRRRHKWMRITGIVLTAIFVFSYSLGFYYLTTAYSTFSRIATADTLSEDGIDVTQDSFNIYITGIDQWNKEKGKDLERSDVNMIVTVCPKTHKILLTSLPRDSYVALHSNGKMDKLTHSGVYGVDETINTVEDWLGVDINYYVKMNFSACVAIINAIDGIDIYNPVEFTSALKPYTYKKGNIHLNGKRALYYARERKSFKGQDSTRVENQMRVVKAIMKKVTSSTTLLTHYGDIMGAVEEGMTLNMSQSDISALVKMQLSDMSGWDIETQKIKGKYEMGYVYSLTQDKEFTVYKTSKKSEKACVNKINEIMNPTQEELDAFNEERQKNSASNFIKKIKK